MKTTIPQTVCHLLTPALLVFAAVTTARADYPNAVTNLNPVGYWRLNEPAATVGSLVTGIATNYGTYGAGANGTYYSITNVGVEASAVTGDTAPYFNPVGYVNPEYVEIPNIPELLTNKNTSIEFWVLRTNLSGTGCALSGGMDTGAGAAGEYKGFIMFLDNANSGTRNYYARIKYTDGVGVTNHVNYNFRLFGLPAGTPLGFWDHVVLTWDTTTIQGYVNGRAISNSATFPAGMHYLPSSIQPIRIAVDSRPSIGIHAKETTLAHVAIYPHVLSSIQVSNHFAASNDSATYFSTITNDAPAGYWTLNESGPFAPPGLKSVTCTNLGSWGSAADGVLAAVDNFNTGAPGVPYPGFGGATCAEYNGSGSRVVVPPQNLITNEFTVTAWYKLAANDGYGAIFNLPLSGDNCSFGHVPLADGPGMVNNRLGVTLSSPTRSATTPGVYMPSNEWAFVAWVASPTESVVYLNGLVSTNTSVNTTSFGDQDFSVTNIFVGDGFNGFLSDLALFDHALTPVQISSLYAAAEVPNDSQYWTQTSAPEADWGAVACSADGTKLVAVVQNGPIYTSTNVGRTWTATSAPSNLVWSAVASSADGNTLVAAAFPGPVYVSRDSGATWTKTSAPAGYYWASVACSADGSKIVAVPYESGSVPSGSAVDGAGGGGDVAEIVGHDGPSFNFVGDDGGISLPPGWNTSSRKYIYLSTNAGTTWTTRDPLGRAIGVFGSFHWTSVAMSENGSEITVTGIESNIFTPWWYGHLFRSVNGGSVWQHPLNFSPWPWNWIDTAGDGTHMILAGGIVGTSYDHGANFFGSSLAPGNWFAVDISADGTRMVAAEWPGGGYPGRIASSIDSGVTWNVDVAPHTTWNGVAMSADGSLAAAPVYQGGIWVSRLVPVIWTHPSHLYANEGEMAEFSVEAESSIGPAYQWLFNGSPIPGQTHAILTLPNVQPADAGQYSVIVSNALGLVTSSNAVLRVNQYPIADASLTPTLYISPNDTDAIVTLDGSLSSDPDGDPLTYLWLSTIKNQPSTLLATDVVATVSLPVGDNAISLLVDDGMARDTNNVTVTVLTTAEAVERVIELVNASDLRHKQPLLATLNAVLASIEHGNCHSALGQLGAFQNKVQAQVTEAALATELFAGAAQVIAALNCDGASRVAAKIRSLKRQANGRLQLQIEGAANQVYFIEASTNLVDWQAIGTTTLSADGTFEFQDAEAVNHPRRFYRLVSPQ